MQVLRHVSYLQNIDTDPWSMTSHKSYDNNLYLRTFSLSESSIKYNYIINSILVYQCYSINQLHFNI